MKETFRRLVVWLLKLEAQAVIRKYQPKIIVVTGSVGKTSAKDAIYTALEPHYFVRKSEKSFNSDIGAPLTVLGVPNGWSNPLTWIRNLIDGAMLILLNVPYPEWLIVEVGADRPGDISVSLAWLKPLIVVATRFPAVSVHVEFYETPEDVQREELAPLYWLRPGGIFIGNADDDFITSAEIPEGIEVVRYGIAPKAHVRAQRVKELTHAKMPRGIAFDVTLGTEKAHVTLDGVVGVAHLYAVLAGIATARTIGVSLEAGAAAFESYEGPAGRMKLIAGINESMLIDDTYNASPIAVEEALRTLANIPRTGRRIAVLGDMLELGPYSVSEHQRIGTYAASKVDLLVTVGVRAKKIASSALEAGLAQDQVLQFDRALDAAEHLKSVVGAGDVVLLKGSQGIRMERATRELMDSPEFAKQLLPRQDAEWLVR